MSEHSCCVCEGWCNMTAEPPRDCGDCGYRAAIDGFDDDPVEPGAEEHPAITNESREVN